jgi:hypothetical protein
MRVSTSATRLENLRPPTCCCQRTVKKLSLHTRTPHMLQSDRINVQLLTRATRPQTSRSDRSESMQLFARATQRVMTNNLPCRLSFKMQVFASTTRLESLTPPTCHGRRSIKRARSSYELLIRRAWSWISVVIFLSMHITPYSPLAMLLAIKHQSSGRVCILRVYDAGLW